MAARCWLFPFAEGDPHRRDLLGGKGAGLAEMTQGGLPVPPGFTITTAACRDYLEHDEAWPDGLWAQIRQALANLEQVVGRRFGDTRDPLLLAVRSGAMFSMPGMMETILNLGLTDASVTGLAARSRDARFAWDSYRRLIQGYGKVVLGVDSSRFEACLSHHKHRFGAEQDAALDVPALTALTDDFKAIVRHSTGRDFPQDVSEQLREAIAAVFRSWNNDRARAYRREYRISDDLGTAVTIQAMVFGNLGDDCATGVAFTRDPATGAHRLVGEYLPNAQGEDVVAGVRTPRPIEEMGDDARFTAAYDELCRIAERLEAHFGDVQDLEFTIERGKLFLLQTRTAKRTGLAAVRVSVAMTREGLIDTATAVRRVEPMQLAQVLHPMIDPGVEPVVLTTGLPASPGAASGKLVLDPEEAQHLSEAGEAVILVRTETSPEDFRGMLAAVGVVTARGGITSHAAVVARGLGKPCITGAAAMAIDETQGLVRVGDVVVRRGEWLTIDGMTGRVMVGHVPTVQPELGEELYHLLAWADEIRGLGVRANADSPQDAETARRFGADGIGLCRTEHMFFEGARIQAVREMILAGSPEDRALALAKLLPLQRADFIGIFRAMDGLPVTIRTLDPPLHEFLPHSPEDEMELAQTMHVDVGVVRRKVLELREANPMLGFRGCRLGITYEEITAMQARAIFSAACHVARDGGTVKPEVMIPLVSTAKEFELQRAVVDRVGSEVFAEEGLAVPYLVGTMIEVPRAALLAAEIARTAEFFSFGTNDLTQTTFGISRDDAGRFLPEYVRRGILPHDPFQSLDLDGVGKLIALATQLGRQTRPGLKVGVCGEHGGDPESIAFCAQLELDYVSASPYRVPVARLAAAHAALDVRDIARSSAI